MSRKPEHFAAQLRPEWFEIRKFFHQFGDDTQTAAPGCGEIFTQHPGKEARVNLPSPSSYFRPNAIQQLLIPVDVTDFISQMASLRCHEGRFQTIRV